MWRVTVLCLLGAVTANDAPVVRTAQGLLRGSILQTVEGREIFSFRGVRFAKPPLGELRFKAPEPAESWDGIRNATEDGFVCMQYDDGYGPTSEDCLFLNVYTTELPGKKDSKLRPVMVFFHPGGYYSVTGNSRWAGPQYLLDEDIVLVTTNYRLATLGFLSNQDEHLRGNYGLKDQVQTLRWVQQNIAAFGGDPNSVTISGYSVGSFSVFLHMVSPMSQGLFHRCIAMSGSPLVKLLPTTPQEQARKQAAALNCSTESSQQMVQCLRQKSAREIVVSDIIFVEFLWDPILIWGPVVEPDLEDGAERFLTAEPLELFLAGNFTKVPVITGHTALEFQWKALAVLNNRTATEELNRDFERIAPISFLYERDTPTSHHISRGLRQFYFKDQPITNASEVPLGQLYADSIIIFAEHRTAKLISARNTAPVYFYMFSYPGRWSYIYHPEDTKTPYGVVHHDDLIYLFYNQINFPLLKSTDPEYHTMKRLTKLWTNFIKSGNPTPDASPLLNNVTWEPYTAENLNYLDIGSSLDMKQGLYNDRITAWESLFPLPQTKSVKKG